MKTTDQIIAEYLKEPIKTGDKACVKGLSSRNKEKEDIVTVVKVDENKIYFQPYGYHELQSRLITEVRKYTNHLGDDPFRKEIRTTSYQIDISQLFWRGGMNMEGTETRMESYFNVDIPETSLNPIVVDENGNMVEYQRGLVWSLEQKQLLIESIYNNVEIGKFVFRKRPFKWVEDRIKAGQLEYTAFADLVDGKQRYTSLVDFVNDKFPDMNGRYFSSFSINAKRKLYNYNYLTYIELDENATDQDAIAVFLAINFTGTPMSRDHIDYVRSIKI